MVSGTKKKRISILDIPIDIVSNEDLPLVIESLCAKDFHQHIILLDFHELMKSRWSVERKRALAQASLIIPTSSLIVFAARFLKKEIPPLRRSYPFIILLLGILERRNKSVYLLGSTIKGIRAAESTLRASYPKLQIVGRHSSGYPKNREQDVITAIKKASPTLLLSGIGLKGNHLWISRHRHHLSHGLGIWEKYCFNVFAGRKKKPNYSFGARFMKGLITLLFKPWRLLRIFRYLAFFFMLIVQRMKQ